MKKGALKSRIVVQSFVEIGRNALNEPIQDWVELAKAWSHVIYGTGVEQRQAAQTTSSQTATFEVLANPKTRSIKTKDRIIFGGVVWDIRSTAPIGRDGVKLNAVRVES